MIRIIITRISTHSHDVHQLELDPCGAPTGDGEPAVTGLILGSCTLMLMFLPPLGVVVTTGLGLI